MTDGYVPSFASLVYYNASLTNFGNTSVSDKIFLCFASTPYKDANLGNGFPTKASSTEPSVYLLNDISKTSNETLSLEITRDNTFTSSNFTALSDDEIIGDDLGDMTKDED